jgi:uncharacterized phage-like protein YoqJ
MGCTVSVVGCAGHRPDKLWIGDYAGHNPLNPLRAWLKSRTRDKLQALRPIHAISGMAIGYDQDFAEVCIDMGVPFIAAVPFEGQERRWPPTAQQHYRKLLRLAYEVVVVCEGGYERWKMQARNEWVVDHSSDLVAAFDGSQGGTANTINYANKVRCEIHRIDPNELRRLLSGVAAS